MGAWGAGNFQNDWALDWLDDLKESSDASIVYSALNRIIEHGGTKYSSASLLERLRGRHRHTDWLTARDSARALAAAEIVASWLGHPPAKLHDGVMKWLQQYSSSFQFDFVLLAQEAVKIIETNSELKDLWEEGNASEWHKTIQDLEQRLKIDSLVK